MDTNIPFIIKNVPYLWLDKNVSLGGLKGWDQKRFSRIYLVPPDQILYQGYIVPPKYCENISEYFRGQTNPIKPINYHNIRLNGNRVNLENKGERIPITMTNDKSLTQKPYKCSICNRINTWRCQAEHRVSPLHHPPREEKRLLELQISILYQILNLPFCTISLNNLQTINPSNPPVLVEPNLAKLRIMFPPGIDYNLIKMTDVGLYSVTRWRETRTIVYEMKKFMNKNTKNLTITDATAGVGGDTLCFAQQFKKVNAIELDPLHCIIISHNLSMYKKQEKINLICANYVDVVGLYNPWPGTPIKQNVIYFDPPWGGPQYKNEKTIILKLDNIPLFKIIWHILWDNLADYIFIKAPKNINLDYFPHYKWVNIRNFKLICIKNR